MTLAPFQTSSQPNVADLTTFVQTVAGIPESALPAGSPYLQWALSYSKELTLEALRCVGSDFYCFAVYLLATSFLVNWCPDQSGQLYFQNLRKQWNLTGFKAGVISSTADEATSESLLTPEFLSGLTLQQLQALGDPYGRQWLSMMQGMSNLWGIS